MSNQLLDAIKHLYPDAKPIQHFMLRDDSDGRGIYLDEWNYSQPRPTGEQIQQAIDYIYG